MRKKILVVGSLNIDLVITADHLPEKGETVIEGEFHTYPGGKGANQAVAAARMGGQVSMVGRVGKDAYGTELLGYLKADGIDHSRVKVDSQLSTGIACITVDKTGQNTIVVASGANMALTTEDFADAGLFTDIGIVILQLEIPVPVVQETLRIAKTKGITTILNPAPACRLSPDILKTIDFLIPNKLELAMLSGLQDTNAGIQKMLDQGVGTVIVPLGEGGAMIARNEYRNHISAFKVNAIDTVAAGDAFVGSFAVGLLEGFSVEQAVQLSNAAAAIAVTRNGAQSSLPDREEVERFIEQTLANLNG